MDVRQGKIQQYEGHAQGYGHLAVKFLFFDTASTAIMHIVLTRFGYNTTDEQVNAVWITRILQTRVGYYAISATTVPQVQGWMTSQSFFIWTSILLRDFLQCDVPQGRT